MLPEIGWLHWIRHRFVQLIWLMMIDAGIQWSVIVVSTGTGSGMNVEICRLGSVAIVGQSIGKGPMQQGVARQTLQLHQATNQTNKEEGEASINMSIKIIQSFTDPVWCRWASPAFQRHPTFPDCGHCSAEPRAEPVCHWSSRENTGKSGPCRPSRGWRETAATGASATWLKLCLKKTTRKGEGKGRGRGRDNPKML